VARGKKAAGTVRTAEDERRRLKAILTRLAPDYSHLGTALRFDSPIQLLVATILSAQTTDDRVNIVTPVLFERYPDASSLADADPAEIERIIYTTGFFRNKTKHILAASRMIVDDFAGEVPRTMAELIRLPGVSRKTANVVLSHAFGLAEGIAVDTHVFRVARRLGLSEAPSPEGVERDLMRLADQRDWIRVADTFIWHGRMVCRSRQPLCIDCKVLYLCPYGLASSPYAPMDAMLSPDQDTKPLSKSDIV
jgi:endonuclease III